jgi:hypothetical protein
LLQPSFGLLLQPFIQSRNYTIKNVVQNIIRPPLFLDAEKDDSFPGQPKGVFDSLTYPKKKYILFTAEEGAEKHCQSGASALPYLINEYLIG